MVQIRIEETDEFIDTDKITRIDYNDYNIAVYYAANSKRFFKVYPRGTRSEFDEAYEIDEFDVLKFLMKYNTDAAYINKKIGSYLPSCEMLKEVV